MSLRWWGILPIVAATAGAAMAQPPAGDDPLDERYSIRGVEPMDYLGYFDFIDRVRARIIADQTPDLRQDDPGLSGLVNFSVVTDAALRLWEIRLLNVHVETEASGVQKLDVRLKWPSDARAIEDSFPFAAIRQSFERSDLDAESPEWIVQRDRMWPDISPIARQIVLSERLIDVNACPGVLAGLRRFRDAPPPLELIPGFAQLGDKPNPTIIITADGWSVSLVWNGGPNRLDGGRASPDQRSALGQALLQLVGDAEECAGLERTLP